MIIEGMPLLSLCLALPDYPREGRLRQQWRPDCPADCAFILQCPAEEHVTNCQKVHRRDSHGLVVLASNIATPPQAVGQHDSAQPLALLTIKRGTRSDTCNLEGNKRKSTTRSGSIPAVSGRGDRTFGL